MTANVLENPAVFPRRHRAELPGAARLMASILVPVTWLSFTLLYVGFWAQGFSLFQSVIVILVSLLVLGGVMGAIWTSYGMRYSRWSWND